jgi:tetratricopeptide (TPR) repeat protein
MGFFRRLFDPRARQAYEAEVAGELRRAAALWLDMGRPEKAAELLIRDGERAGTVEERVQAWTEALHLLAEEKVEARRELEGRIGLAVLEEARAGGVVGAQGKRLLADAAERLERAGRWSDAADAWELLGRSGDVARCLEKAGEIERLEKVLEASLANERRASRLRSLMEEYELGIRVGARDLARRALREAIELAPEDGSIAELLRRLEERWPRGRRLRLDVGGARVGLTFALPAVIGRAEADVVLRGSSVSRRHCEVDLRDDVVVVRDLGSRNGTLVAGVPIGGEIALSGPTEIGLGEDVAILVRSGEVGKDERGLIIDVIRGLDRGERILAGRGELRVAGIPGSFVFVEDRAVVKPDPGVSAVLGSQKVATAVDLLIGDVLTVGDVRVEVLP